MNIAVIGCGYWGKNHVRVLNELGYLYGVCDKAIRSKDLGGGYVSLANYKYLADYQCIWSDDYKAFLKDPKVDAVVIATPTNTHYQIAKDALLAHKHVLVEKPMTMNSEEAETLVDIAAAQGRILSVGHILEYHPAVIKLKEFIRHGHLGEIQYIYSNRLNIGKIRRNEDVLSSFAPHDIALILGIVGQMPNKVRVEESEYMTEGVSDITMMHLEFPGGVKGHIFVSWLHPVKEQKLVVIGDRGMAVFDDGTNEKVRIYNHKVEWVGADDVANIEKAEYKLLPGALVRAEPLKAELKHFVECCEKGLESRTGGMRGWEVLRVMEMARQKKEDYEIESGSFQVPFVHESCYVDEDVEIGEGTKIWYFSHIQKGAKIGENCTIGQNVNIGPGVVIGDNVKIQNNVSVYEGVTIEDDVFLGPSCVFTNVRDPKDFGKGKYKKTLVKKGAIIGANATIVCGVVIGKDAFVGAGSVVTKDVKEHKLVYGNPGYYRQRGK